MKNHPRRVPSESVLPFLPTSHTHSHTHSLSFLTQRDPVTPSCGLFHRQTKGTPKSGVWMWMTRIKGRVQIRGFFTIRFIISSNIEFDIWIYGLHNFVSEDIPVFSPFLLPPTLLSFSPLSLFHPDSNQDQQVLSNSAAWHWTVTWRHFDSLCFLQFLECHPRLPAPMSAAKKYTTGDVRLYHHHKHINRL